MPGLPTGELHTYDVLVVDVLLQGGQRGTMVLEAAKAEPQLDLPPIVVCTAASRVYLETHAPEIAANNLRVLHKPFDIATLMTELRAAVHGDKDDQS